MQGSAAAPAAAGAALALSLAAVAVSGATTQVAPDTAGAGIGQPLAEGVADAERGRRIVIDPQRGNCLICHRVPDAPEERFQGDVGPPLAGVARRASAARLRLRIVDSTRIDPDSVMPAYHRVQDLQRVAPRWRGKPVLSAAEVEDVVAYLLTLDGRHGNAAGAATGPRHDSAGNTD